MQGGIAELLANLKCYHTRVVSNSAFGSAAARYEAIHAFPSVPARVSLPAHVNKSASLFQQQIRFPAAE